MKKLALSVYLGERYLGCSQVDTSSKIVPMSLQDEVHSAIAGVCFMRDDDLMATHSFDEFTVKGTTIEI